MNISELKTGDKFTAIIMDKPSEGVIHVQSSSKIFLCQNTSDGDFCKERHGYKYSWSVSAYGDGELCETQVKDLKVVKNSLKVGDKFIIKAGTRLKYGVTGTTGFTPGVFTGEWEVRKVTSSFTYFDRPGNTDTQLYKVNTAKLLEALGDITKIYGYRLIKELPTAPVGTEIAPDGTYKATDGKTRRVDADLLKDTKWFSAIAEEPLKVGEYAIDTASIVAIISKIKDGNYYTTYPSHKYANKDGSDTLWTSIGSLKRATKEQVEATKQRIITNVGTKKATLFVQKDGKVEIQGKSETLSIPEIKKFYQTLVPVSLGGFNVTIADKDEQIFRIGCSSEDNRVSVNEIGLVLTEYAKL